MLIYATKGDHKDVVKFLLEKGAAVDGRDNVSNSMSSAFHHL